jgi:hypothetical protein
MSYEVTEAEKQTFQEAAARRKANGIKLGRFAVHADTNQIISLNDFMDGWIKKLGKQRAVDYLIVCMRKGEEALQRAIEERKEARGRKR